MNFKKGWLLRQLKKASFTTATWPKWKRDFLRTGEVSFVRIDTAARLCMDCNGVYDCTVHPDCCPACASRQSINVQLLLGGVIK